MKPKTENQLEEALKKCEQRFVKAFEESPLILTLTSAQSDHYIEVNDTFERITGWNRNETLGRTPIDLGIWVDPNQRRDFVRRVLAGDTVRNLEVRSRMKNGEIRTMSGSAVLIEIRGETCILSMVADITPLREAEEAKQMADRISSMARVLIQAQDDEREGIARELHDHIDRLALLSMVLQRIQQNPRESIAECSQDIAGAIQEIDDLVSDIQTLSQRLHSPRLEYLGLATAAASFCKELSDQKNVKIFFTSEGIPEGLFKESSVCLFRILQEALQNATEHSDSREFEVSLSAELDEVYLTVHDPGIGFNPEKAPGGGFTRMKERVKLVGGKLWIESPRERGTTLHARVPVKPRTSGDSSK